MGAEKKKLFNRRVAATTKTVCAVYTENFTKRFGNREKPLIYATRLLRKGKNEKNNKKSSSQQRPQCYTIKNKKPEYSRSGDGNVSKGGNRCVGDLPHRKRGHRCNDSQTNFNDCLQTIFVD